MGGAARADFNDGVVALMTGNYEQAVQTLMPLAEMSNHAYAQYFLGRMYADGQGVERDISKAASWYRKAAEQGVAEAQYRLGNMYRDGTGVPRDLEYAFAWYSVANHLGHGKSGGALEESTAMLSPEELEEAQKLSRDLIQNYGHVPESTSRSQ
jgi:TPR repeat protein